MSRQPQVAGPLGALDRLVDGPVLGMPAGGAAQEVRRRLWALTFEAIGEEIMEQPVVPEPPSLPIERNDEGVRPHQFVEPSVAVAALEHLVEQWRRQPWDDRRREQERSGAVVERVEDLFDEVVGDFATATSERGRKHAAALAAGRQRGEGHSGRPPLGERMQVGDAGRVARHAHRLEVALALLDGHRQVVGMQLAEIAARSQAGETKIRLHARRQHELRTVGNHVDDGLEHGQTLEVGDVMDVVEHQHER